MSNSYEAPQKTNGRWSTVALVITAIFSTAITIGVAILEIGRLEGSITEQIKNTNDKILDVKTDVRDLKAEIHEILKDHETRLRSNEKHVAESWEEAGKVMKEEKKRNGH